MALEDLEKWLAPWERDKDGKPLDEPAEIDPVRLKKYLHGLLADKEKLQETVADKDTELAGAKEQLTTLQREHEDDAARQAREQKERDQEIENLRKDSAERRKLDALAEAFPDATTAKLKKLAKRVQGEEKDWVADAKELVEDGFRISDKNSNEEQVDEYIVDDADDVSIKPVVRRSSGQPVDTSKATGKKKSVADELNEAGILPADY